MLKTVKVFENTFCLFVTVAQSKRCFNKLFYFFLIFFFKTVLTTESETTEATTQTMAMESSGKSILDFQTVFFHLRSISKY